MFGFHLTQPDLPKGGERIAVENELENCQKIDLVFRNILIQNSKLTLRQIKKMEQESYLMLADEAVKYGIAHGII